MDKQQLSMLYNRTLFLSKTLRPTASLYLSRLPKSVTVLTGRGSSGCSIISAMMAKTRRNDLFSVIVRKPREDSHGDWCAGYVPEKLQDKNVCVVDDFIDTGATVMTVMKWWEKHYNIKPKYIMVARPMSKPDLGSNYAKCKYLFIPLE